MSFIGRITKPDREAMEKEIPTFLLKVKTFFCFGLSDDGSEFSAIGYFPDTVQADQVLCALRDGKIYRHFRAQLEAGPNLDVTECEVVSPPLLEAP